MHKLFIERELGYQLAILNIPVCAHLTRTTSRQDSRLIDILHRVLRYYAYETELPFKSGTVTG